MIGPLALLFLSLVLVLLAIGMSEYEDLISVILGTAAVLCLGAAEWYVLAIEGAWWFVPLTVGLIGSLFGLPALGQRLGSWLARRRHSAYLKTRREP